MKRSSFTVALLLGVCSCSSPSKPDSTAAHAEEIFASGEFELSPGAEKYICWTGNLPSDRQLVVREISADYTPGTHHVLFAWTLAPEPEGMQECPVLFKTTWVPIYLGGVNASPLRMPEGTAVDLGFGKQVVLQLHLQNTTREPIKSRVTMHMKLQPPAEKFEAAGVFGIDNRDIALPALTNDVQTTMSCKAPRDMKVFSVLGHMHKFGKELVIRKNADVVFTQHWNFDEQPITPFALEVRADDELSLTCTHSNSLETPIAYGESSDNEMCATIFYYSPYDSIDGCIKFPPVPDAGAGD